VLQKLVHPAAQVSKGLLVRRENQPHIQSPHLLQSGQILTELIITGEVTGGDMGSNSDKDMVAGKKQLVTFVVDANVSRSMARG